MIEYSRPILPLRDLHDGNRVLRLGDPSFVHSTYESLRDWVSSSKPSVLVEHQVDGTKLGNVVAIELREDAIWAHMELEEEAEPYMQSYVSPRIAWNFLADNTHTYDAALLELSFVSVPRWYVGQYEANQHSIDSDLTLLSEITLSSDPTEAHPMDPYMEEQIMKLEERIAALEANFSELSDTTEPTEEPKDSELNEPTELEAALARIAELELELEALKVEQELDIEDSVMSATLAAIKHTNPKGYESLMSGLKAKKAPVSVKRQTPTVPAKRTSTELFLAGNR